MTAASVFDNLNDPNTENMHCGFVQLVLHMVTLAMPAAVLCNNTRELNSWHQRTVRAKPTIHPPADHADARIPPAPRDGADTIDAAYIAVEAAAT